MLGCHLVSAKGDVVTAGRIVETEAYHGPDDLASHAASRRTGRVEAMYGDVGLAYVYRSYGMHVMLNVVAHEPGGIGAILIRALEPFTGLDAMRERRGVAEARLFCAGPGRLCQALGIEMEDHGRDLCTDPLLCIRTGGAMPQVLVSGRIGVSRGDQDLWRYFEAESRYVSAHRRGVPYDLDTDQTG
jgi:DNA-3-methyladenine glycosylase